MSRVRIVPEYPGLVIADDGRIQGPSGKWLKMSPSPMYMSFSIYRPGRTPGRGWTHVAVCTAFHGPKPTPEHEVAHCNGNPLDNRADNLRWATRQENARDAVRHGTWTRGERQGHSRLTAVEVIQIRARKAQGESLDALALAYGVHRATIADVVKRRSWRHI